jgi:hypothetical protein
MWGKKKKEQEVVDYSQQSSSVANAAVAMTAQKQDMDTRKVMAQLVEEILDQKDDRGVDEAFGFEYEVKLSLVVKSKHELYDVLDFIADSGHKKIVAVNVDKKPTVEQ